MANWANDDQSNYEQYLQAALRQIDDLANEDVEMAAPLSEYATFFVVDTNILLHHFEALSQFVEDFEKSSLPVIVIVPGAVILELDGQKNRNGLAWFARRATAWLLEKIRERRSVKGQAQEQTCKSTGNWKIKEPGEIITGEMFNDSLILDCCMFFSRTQRTVLCSADNNLCIISQTQGVPTITPTRVWSSRDIAQKLFGNMIDPMEFTGHKESYQGFTPNNGPSKEKKTKAKADKVKDSDDDMIMDIDEVDESSNDTWQSEHPINMLHVAVVDHFSRLLSELTVKAGAQEPEDEVNRSRHAPKIPKNKKHFSLWNVADCLEYLTGKRKVTLVNPRLDFFLRKVYTPGSRPGREWSRQDWRMSLGNLKAISEAWDDVSIRESLYFLEPHVERVFGMPLRNI